MATSPSKTSSFWRRKAGPAPTAQPPTLSPASSSSAPSSTPSSSLHRSWGWLLFLGWIFAVGYLVGYVHHGVHDGFHKDYLSSLPHPHLTAGVESSPLARITTASLSSSSSSSSSSSTLAGSIPIPSAYSSVEAMNLTEVLGQRLRMTRGRVASSLLAAQEAHSQVRPTSSFLFFPPAHKQPPALTAFPNNSSSTG